ncbi:hypothetical protein Tco_0327067 [Tanacetum coccineum]
MAELPCNKFTGDKGKIILVIRIRAMLLVQGEMLQVGRQELLSATAVKVKDIWLEAQEVGQILDEEQLVFLADLGIPASQVQIVIPHNAAFQTKDLDTYDSDCDDLSTAQAVLMANISLWFRHCLRDNEISSDSNIIPYSQYLQETQHASVQDTNLQAQQDSMILSVIEQMSEQMINHVNNWEKANKEQNNESITVKLERYKKSRLLNNYAGRLYVKRRGKPIEILAKLNELAGFASLMKMLERIWQISFDTNRFVTALRCGGGCSIKMDCGYSLKAYAKPSMALCSSTLLLLWISLRFSIFHISSFNTFVPLDVLKLSLRATDDCEGDMPGHLPNSLVL